MSKSIFFSFSNRCVLDNTQLSNSVDFVHDFLMAFFRDLIVYHFTLCSCIFDSPELLLFPCVFHVEVTPVQIVLGNLLVVVEYCKLIMLLRLQILLEMRMTTSPRRLVVELLLNRLGLSFSHPSDCGVCQSSMINFMINRILLLFLKPSSDRFDPIKVIHISNWAWHFISHFISSWSRIVWRCIRRLVPIVIPTVSIGFFYGARVPTTSRCVRISCASICICSWTRRSLIRLEVNLLVRILSCLTSCIVWVCWHSIVVISLFICSIAHDHWTIFHLFWHREEVHLCVAGVTLVSLFIWFGVYHFHIVSITKRISLLVPL